MGYDNDFYAAYERYLEEETVADAHTMAVSLLGYPDAILDLGCGKSNEILRRMREKPDVYLGVDANAAPGGPTVLSELTHRVIKGDYRDGGDLERVLAASWGIDTFVSLFSTEITGPSADNYAIYDRLFDRGFKEGLVSGFYYVSKKSHNPIGESGGLTSWQTLDAPEDVIREAYTETRLIMPVPSMLFGPDVYEVWKLFRARE